MTGEFLVDGPDDAQRTLVLAHGAGAPMDSPFMATIAEGLAELGHRIVRFEFDYMAQRRHSGRKRPPERLPALLNRWRTVIDAFSGPGDLVIGGKSMGGRIASMIAAEAPVRGLVCLGYPFHPPGKPNATRIEHLPSITCPALIVQGTRDPFGTYDDVASYALPDWIQVHWIEDGDHDLKPRKSSGIPVAEARRSAIEAVDGFLKSTG